MRRALALIAFVSLAACGSSHKPETLTADPATTRELAQGTLVGATSVTGAHVWRAVPFAAPPVGELRWRAPRAPEPWQGTREALAFGQPCAQLTNNLDAAQGFEPGQVKGDEDCLTLDIYAPNLAAVSLPAGGPGLPVMVWIHGGGNTWGSSSQFDGGTLATKENVIVVAIQYRLGPIGWLAHEGLRASAETADDGSANFATLDMIRGLEWVRDNIAVFGGDPSRVTIFGESAGGHNVASLIASPRAAGLFHGAIIQSGSVETTSLAAAEFEGGGRYGAISSRTAAAALWAAAGRSEGDLASASPADVAAFLRSQPLEAVLRVFDAGGGQLAAPRVIADGIVLPTDGIAGAMARPGGINAVPVITGTNLDETKLFNLINPAYANRYFGVIVRLKDPLLFDAVSDYQSLMWRVRAVDNPANAMTAAGHPNVYAYRFDWDEQGTRYFTNFSELMGAAHAVEIPFVFGHFHMFGRIDPLIFNGDNAPGRLALSDAMMSYWAEFARTGAPGKSGSADRPAWQPWNPASGSSVLVFDTDAGGGIRHEATTLGFNEAVEALEGDPRLVDPALKCEVFNAVVAWSPEVENYRTSVLAGSCTNDNPPS